MSFLETRIKHNKEITFIIIIVKNVAFATITLTVINNVLSKIGNAKLCTINAKAEMFAFLCY